MQIYKNHFAIFRLPFSSTALQSSGPLAIWQYDKECNLRFVSVGKIPRPPVLVFFFSSNKLFLYY